MVKIYGEVKQENFNSAGKRLVLATLYADTATELTDNMLGSSFGMTADYALSAGSIAFTKTGNGYIYDSTGHWNAV